MITVSKKAVLNKIKSLCNDPDLIVEYEHKNVNNYHGTIRAKMEDETDNN